MVPQFVAHPSHHSVVPPAVEILSCFFFSLFWGEGEGEVVSLIVAFCSDSGLFLPLKVTSITSLLETVSLGPRAANSPKNLVCQPRDR